MKDGIVVSRDGEVVIRGVPNRTFWVKADLPGDMDVMKNPRFVEKFSRYYSVDLENYMVQDEYVERGVVMNTRPE